MVVALFLAAATAFTPTQDANMNGAHPLPAPVAIFSDLAPGKGALVVTQEKKRSSSKGKAAEGGTDLTFSLPPPPPHPRLWNARTQASTTSPTCQQAVTSAPTLKIIRESCPL
jgi:hypothetical protein